MDIAYLKTPEFSFFSDAQKKFKEIVTQLQSEHCADHEHGAIEQQLQTDGFALLKALFQGWLDLQADKESQVSSIESAGGKKLTHVKKQTKRKLTSLFGEVIVTRMRYSQRKGASVSPFDAKLNLANDQYSDGLRHRVAKEAIRGAFDNVVEVIKDTTGGQVPKRQCLQLTRDIAQDFESYYENKTIHQVEETKDLLILTFDGKGIVMRSESLRDCTKKSAEKSKKLNSRLSQGEKKDRKRKKKPLDY